MPTLVIHGVADAIVPIEGAGQRTHTLLRAGTDVAAAKACDNGRRGRLEPDIVHGTRRELAWRDGGNHRAHLLNGAPDACRADGTHRDLVVVDDEASGWNVTGGPAALEGPFMPRPARKTCRSVRCSLRSGQA